MSEYPFFRFFVGDYLADTRHLSTEEHGAYLLLLIDYWQKGFLKNDPSKLKNICQLSRHKFNKYFPTLLEFFEDSGDGYLINKRMEKELQNAGKKSAKARAAAKARWDANADADAMPEHMPEQCLDDAMSEVRSQKTFPPLPPTSGGTAGGEKHNPRALGESLRQKGKSPRQLTGKEAYDRRKLAEIERQVSRQVDDAWAQIHACSPEENLAAIKRLKESLRPQDDEVVL